jgi:hypothetical protein
MMLHRRSKDASSRWVLPSNGPVLSNTKQRYPPIWYISIFEGRGVRSSLIVDPERSSE